MEWPLSRKRCTFRGTALHFAYQWVQINRVDEENTLFTHFFLDSYVFNTDRKHWSTDWMYHSNHYKSIVICHVVNDTILWPLLVIILWVYNVLPREWEYCVLLYVLQWFIKIYQWNKNQYFHYTVFRDYFLLYLMFNSL